MRNTLLDPYEDIPRIAVVTANDYPASSTFPSHTHRRSQFAYAASGTISVFTARENLVVPPQRACWIPAGIDHEMHMRGPVTMLNAFLPRTLPAPQDYPMAVGWLEYPPATEPVSTGSGFASAL